MSNVLHGVIHGARIELERNPGLEDGERVEVVLRTLPRIQQGATPRTAAGMLADYPEMDDYWAEVERERKSTFCREVAE